MDIYGDDVIVNQSSADNNHLFLKVVDAEINP